MGILFYCILSTVGSKERSIGDGRPWGSLNGWASKGVCGGWRTTRAAERSRASGTRDTRALAVGARFVQPLFAYDGADGAPCPVCCAIPIKIPSGPRM